MRRHRTLGAAILVGSLALPGAAASCQGDREIVLHDVEVIVSDGRLVLSTPRGDTYELAGLETPLTCSAADGRTWACGEGARQALAAAVAGETLECRIIEQGPPPAVQCFAQSRNLNVWMLHVGRAKLQPAWRNRIPEYDEAQLSAQAAGAMVWSESPGADDGPSDGQDSGQEAGGTEPSEMPSRRESARNLAMPRTHVGLQAAGRTVAGAFLLLRRDGNVLSYVLERPADGGVTVQYREMEMGSPTELTGFEFVPDVDWVPALGLREDSVVHHARGAALAYASRVPQEPGKVPLAYLLDAPDVEGRSYSDIMLNGMVWASRRGHLHPRQIPLETTVERRGATGAERRTIGAGLPEDQLRAGVWAVGTLRVVVAEDSFGCARWTWCRFAVLEDADVVVSGIARETPALPVLKDASTPGATGEAATDIPGLVWAAPGGYWMRWTP